MTRHALSRRQALQAALAGAAQPPLQSSPGQELAYTGRVTEVRLA